MFRRPQTGRFLIVAMLCTAQEAESDCGCDTPSVSLVRNGLFKEMVPGARLPMGWTTNRPDNVRRIELASPDPNKTQDKRYAIEMTGDAQLMATYGVDLIGDRIAFKANTRYRCTGFTRSTGPNLIVFVKGYAQVNRRIDGKVQTFDDVVYQMRKEIPATKTWRKFNLDFDVKPILEFSDFKHHVKYLRITLWSYWPVGTCWWGDIKFEEVGPIDATQARSGLAVTHVGAKPNVPKQAPKPTFDREQTWFDAVNAFKAGDFAKAAEYADLLLVRAPNDPNYRVLMARALAGREQWPHAGEHARWVLSPPQGVKIEPWQHEWAKVVDAHVRWRSGDTNSAVTSLNEIASSAKSAHARRAASELLEQIRSAG